MLDCESDNSEHSHQTLLEGASVQAQIIEGEFAPNYVMEESSFATFNCQ